MAQPRQHHGTEGVAEEARGLTAASVSLPAFSRWE
jgi:hypothetical protein